MASGREMGGVGRNTESQRSADRAAADRNRSAAAGGGNQYAGYRGPIGTNAPNTSIAPGGYGLSSDEKRQYEGAKTEYANRSFGKRVFDFFSPVKSVDPQINQPSSYAGGKYHHGFNPAGLIGGAVAGALVPGAGMVAGPALSSIWNGSGMHDVVLTGPGYGFSKSYPDGGPGYNSSTGYGGPSSSSPNGPNAQNTGNAPGLTAFPGTPKPVPSGAPFGPDTGAVTQPNPMSAFFKPKLPNHSLPPGYSSMFPGSLSPEDMGMLYAQALK